MVERAWRCPGGSEAGSGWRMRPASWSKKSALILMLDACDYELPLPQMLDDTEFTIVHELDHLELASLPRSEASRGSEEHAVNRIAEALLKLDRQR